MLYVDDAKHKTQSDYDSSVEKNKDKSSNGKSEGRGTVKKAYSKSF